MDKQFSDPARRFTRAKEHIDDLESGINAFVSSKPYAQVIEVDSDTGNKIHKVKPTAPIPDDLLGKTVEIIEGLRTVLDKCGFVAAQAIGNTRLKGTHFPIADTDNELDTAVIGRGRCKDLPDEILAFFRSFQPYKTGNPTIWALNKLANRSKHGILMPIVTETGNGFIESFKCPGRLVEMKFPPPLGPGK